MTHYSGGFRVRASRGGKATAAAHRWNIEGVNYSVKQIAERIGRSEDIALTRLKEQQAKPGPLTWAGLETQRKRGRQKQ